MQAFRAKIRRFVESPGFSNAIIAVITLNAVTLGLETSARVTGTAGALLQTFDRIALAVYVIEIALKLIAFGPRFFRSGWNIFDFIIVGIALTPSAGAFSVLRALRILRALRLLSVVPQMRAVVGALLSAVPGMGAIMAVLGLVYYIAAVMTTKMFAETFPDWFGDIGASMYSLFQIMTLESWSMGIVRPVMETHPWAWAFFVPFIIVTSFAVLNLFIALIVNSLNAITEAEYREHSEEAEVAAQNEREALLQEIAALRQEMADLRSAVLEKSTR
ncbi:MAG: ion transporter [Pseudomonadota bacterium]